MVRYLVERNILFSGHGLFTLESNIVNNILPMCLAVDC